jgi:hypothetical protein
MWDPSAAAKGATRSGGFALGLRGWSLPSAVLCFVPLVLVLFLAWAELDRPPRRRRKKAPWAQKTQHYGT